MADRAIIDIGPLGFPWQTEDPFLFCVHHNDAYPAGNADFGPATSLEGRRIGMDFDGKDGWSMYHGDVVPGFPQHPHRGFETLTLVRKGRIDHSDSLGATARFGGGDAQWMTAGKGIVHSEMFPLLNQKGDNHLELFQIWINLPAEDKMVDPYFSMLWSEGTPKFSQHNVDIAVIAGELAGRTGQKPPPNSWAARPEADIGIYTLAFAPGGAITLPAAKAGTNRTVYFFEGETLTVSGHRIDGAHRIRVRADVPVKLGSASGGQVLVLQGRPIGEPVAQHGPFVMNTMEEIRETFADYRRTQFGGWPWPSHGPVHGATQGRFAKHADGRVEERES